MPFMPKEEMLAAAERLGVDLSGLSWSEQQKAVQEALAKEDSFLDSPEPKPKPTKKESKNELHQKMADSIKGSKPVLLAEQYNPVRNQIIKYAEYLGDEVRTKNVSYLTDGVPEGLNGGQSMSYIVQGKTGRKAYALSTIPQMNVRITYDPNKHWYAPIMTDYNGRQGYVWKHPMYRGIKPLLIESGYYDDYADQFDGVKHPRNIWCAGGKIWAVDIPLVERIFREVERKAKQDEY